MMKSTIREKTQSLEDTLEELRRHETHLEEMVKQRTHELNDALEVINGSIQYASHIQRSILPDTSWLNGILADHFVHWEPRDVVGGDIYWCRPWGEGTLIILGDCTGHGVPGAFMTLITTGALDRAQLENTPGDVSGLIKTMNQLVQLTLVQHRQEGSSDDGMELGVCFIPHSKDHMLFSGARFELFEVYDGKTSITKGTKKGIGYRKIPFDQGYETHTVTLKEGQSFYMTSDGLIDQVGGQKRRAFGKRRFSSLLASIQNETMETQQKRIVESLVRYQGDEKRRDDVAILGFKVI
jgi:serine phosphatase RsbU (regulator of sigma subunit)